MTRITNIPYHLWERLAVAFVTPVGGKENVHKFEKLKLSVCVFKFFYLRPLTHEYIHVDLKSYTVVLAISLSVCDNVTIHTQLSGC